MYKRQVLDRATTPQALARAFANLGQYFLAGENLAAAEGDVYKRQTPRSPTSPRWTT